MDNGEKYPVVTGKSYFKGRVLVFPFERQYEIHFYVFGKCISLYVRR